MWQQCCIDIIMAAFSLRELGYVHYWFTRWSTPNWPRRGRDLLAVAIWDGDILMAAWWLYLMGLAWLKGNSGLLFPWPYPASINTAQDGFCAASLDALWVIHRVLMGMNLVGMALLCICWALFPHWRDELDAMGGALVAATPAGQRMIAGRARLIGVLSMLGKNLLHPVFPCLLMSDALLGYRCLPPTLFYLGLFYIIFASLISSVFVCIYIVVDRLQAYAVPD